MKTFPSSAQSVFCSVSISELSRCEVQRDRTIGKADNMVENTNALAPSRILRDTSPLPPQYSPLANLQEIPKSLVLSLSCQIAQIPERSEPLDQQKGDIFTSVRPTCTQFSVHTAPALHFHRNSRKPPQYEMH